MICPRWVMTRIQPIAISDVLEYLVAALDVPESAGEIVEIGGASIETYRSMMLTYARIRRIEAMAVARSCADSALVFLLAQSGDAISGLDHPASD